MSRKRRETTLTTFLIVFVILTFCASFLSYLTFTSQESAKEALAETRGERDGWIRRYRAKWTEVQSLRRVLGYYEESKEPETTRTDTAVVTAHLERLSRDCVRASMPRPPTVQAMLTQLERLLGKVTYKLKKVEKEKTVCEEQLASEVERRRLLLAEKQRLVEELRARAATDKERLGRVIEQKEGQITGLRDSNTSLHGMLEASRAEKARLVQSTGRRLTRLQGRVDKLREREKRQRTLLPDGLVIRSDADHGFAYLDVGRRHGVRAGSRFHVYEVLKGGRRRHKGEVRVVRVEKDFCQCSILRMGDGANPITKGDFVWNRFFERGIRKRFVLLGRFAKEGAGRSREEVRRLIQEHGHIVSDRADGATDFAVLGDGYREDGNWKTVQEFKVELVRVKDILESLGPGTHR